MRVYSAAQHGSRDVAPHMRNFFAFAKPPRTKTAGGLRVAGDAGIAWAQC